MWRHASVEGIMFQLLANVFGPQEIASLDRALVLACRALAQRGDPRISGPDREAVRVSLARTIVTLAEAGETEEGALADAAVAALGERHASAPSWVR
jgi:ABC-type hemin transport system ATPase subunit